MLGLEKYAKKRICVAFSGGADSTALLHYLIARQEAFGYTLFAVHCEHGIRGEESLRDKAFVEAVCRRWEIPLFHFSEDCPARAKREKESLETTARRFRYECFSSLVDEGKTDYIATAHHLDDEAETVLFRLARGSALTGAGGIREENGWLIRPFLSLTKQEILQYVEENTLDYCVDKTNFETDATRNKLRLQVLPLLSKIVPNASANLARFASLAKEDDALLYELAGALLTKTDEGYLVAFSRQKPLFTRAVLCALKGLGVSRDYTALHLACAYALQDKERGAQLHLPCGAVAEKREKGVAVYIPKTENISASGAGTPFGVGRFALGRYEVNVSLSPLEPQGVWAVLRLDADKLPSGCVFRFRRDGDRIQAFGGAGKSLKKLFNERKTPVKERATLPLIVAGDTIFAVCGVEIADTVKVTEDTRRVLYIAIY